MSLATAPSAEQYRSMVHTVAMLEEADKLKLLTPQQRATLAHYRSWLEHWREAVKV